MFHFPKVRAELLGNGWRDNVLVTRSNFPGEGQGGAALPPGVKRKAALLDGGSVRYKFGGDAVAAVMAVPAGLRVKKEKEKVKKSTNDDDSDDDDGGFMDLFNDTKVSNKAYKHLLG